MELKRIKNEKIIKMYNWAMMFDYIDVDPCSYSYDEDANSYRCDFYMSKYKKIIIGYGDTYYDACVDVANQVSVLIDIYLEEHPDFELRKIYSLEENDIVLNGEDIPTIVASEERIKKQFSTAVNREALINEFMKAYQELDDDNYGFFFQVISESLLPQYNNGGEGAKALMNSVVDRFGKNASTVRARRENGLYIITAKILFKDELMENKEDLQ